MRHYVSARAWLILLVAAGLTVAAYQCHARSVGKLEGEIKARGESIKQLSELAAKKQQAFQKAKARYTKTPTLETCSVVLISCEERHDTDSTQIAQQKKQIADLKKLKKKDKLFGFLPRPTVQIGWCLTADLRTGPCVSGGFSVFK
jgi:hypothetical protein